MKKTACYTYLNPEQMGAERGFKREESHLASQTYIIESEVHITSIEYKELVIWLVFWSQYNLSSASTEVFQSITLRFYSAPTIKRIKAAMFKLEDTLRSYFQ